MGQGRRYAVTEVGQAHGELTTKVNTSLVLWVINEVQVRACNEFRTIRRGEETRQRAGGNLTTGLH